jgi:hypothetical protein
MVDEITVNKFIDYLSRLKANDASVLVGGVLRKDFELTWRAVVDDPDVGNMIRRMLFIPGPVPDMRGWILKDVLDHLRGLPVNPPLEILDDVVVDKALITEVRVERDAEGPVYRVTYSYGPDGSCAGKIAPGYDTMHSSLNGWDVDALDLYWSKGNAIPCNFRSGNMEKHCVYVP